MKETLLSKEDTGRVGHAVWLTRCMRSAALVAAEKGEEITTPEREAEEQGVLRDSERLAIVTAQLIVAAISVDSQQDQREQLDLIIKELRIKYAKYPTTTYWNRNEGESVDGLTSDAKSLDRDWEAGLTHSYIKRNEIPLSINELLSSKVGIIAPLSTDYHRAELHRQFVVQNVRRECFELKPAAPNMGSKRVVLPKTEDGQQVFSSKREIGIFVDLVLRGRTAGVVYDAVRGAYPGKTVHGVGEKYRSSRR